MKNQIKIGVIDGNIVNVEADAYIVPQYADCLSHHGVANCITRSGSEVSKGMNEYESKCPLPHGSVVMTPSYGGKSKYLLHTAVLGTEREKKFSTIQRAVYLSLLCAEANGIEKIVCPSLGLDQVDPILPSDSAKAILSAVDLFPNKKRVIKEFTIIVFFSPWTRVVFDQININELYRGALPPQEPGFSLAKWIETNFRH